MILDVRRLSEVAMQTETNPYEAPTQRTADSSRGRIRLPLEGWFLVCFWILEGGAKAIFISAGVSRGFNPIPEIATIYTTWNRLYFLLAASFIIVETIGPWIGLLYLIRYRYTDTPFDNVMWIILKRASVISVLFALLLMLLCEVATLFAVP